MSGECVFDLVGNEAAASNAYEGTPAAGGAGTAARPLYKKKNVPPPTASTFGIHGTSAVVGNAGGDNTDYSVHPSKKPTGTFGREVGPTVDPASFLKKNEGPQTASRGAPTVNASSFKKSDCCREKLKPDVPDRRDRPVMGLTTEKNYVIANAVENTLAVPTRQIPPVQPRATDREDFGKVPRYLEEIKGEIESRRQDVETFKAQTRAANEKWSELSEAQLAELRSGLQRRWDSINKEYQSKGFSKLETPSQKQHQQRLEKELCALEFAMQKVGRSHVFVYDDQMH